MTDELTRARRDNVGAHYLAQRNQQAAARTDEHVRPRESAPRRRSPAEQAGMPDGNSSEYREAVAGQAVDRDPQQPQRAQRSRLSQRRRSAGAASARRRWRSRRPRRVRSRPAPPRQLRLRGKRADGTLEVVPNTRDRARALSRCLAAQVERIGTLNFPQMRAQRLPAIRCSKSSIAATAAWRSAHRAARAAAGARPGRAGDPAARGAVRSVPGGAAQAIRRAAVRLRMAVRRRRWTAATAAVDRDLCHLRPASRRRDPDTR